MTSQAALLGGSVHDAAQRAADILAVLLPRAGNRLAPGSPGERDAVIEVLEAHGEPSPVEISPADLEGLRQAALELREVFTAGDVATAADRINGLLAGRAHPPRLTTHGGASGWHLHVDSSDDAPSGRMVAHLIRPGAGRAAGRAAGSAGRDLRLADVRQAVRERGPGQRAALLLGRLRHPRAGGRAPPGESRCRHERLSVWNTSTWAVRACR